MERFDLTPFTAFCTENNLPLPESAVPHLKLFGALLLEWNEKINLTAITNPEEIVFKHFIDCAALLKFLNPQIHRYAVRPPPEKDNPTIR